MKMSWLQKEIKYCMLKFLGLVLSFCFFNITAQDRKALEERKIETQKEIEYSNNLLNETQKNRRNSLQRVRILSKRIQLRNDIIRNINLDLDLINKNIEQKNSMITDMEKDLSGIREQYAELVVHAYWSNRKKDKLMFILSSEHFNQAYRRMKYIKQYTAYRKKQAILIRQMQISVVKELEMLEDIKLEKEVLVLEKRNENHSLEKEKQNKNRMVSELKRKEKELKSEIIKKRKIAEKLEKEIAKIIAEEVRKARSKSIYDFLTPEEKLISDNFQGNKGKLPWPVERGLIISKFGVHPHPVLKQITIDNNGVDIATVRGAEARALFEGVVTKVVAILGANYTVIIRHGNFLTVYQNLVDLKVKQGDDVAVKQVLGTVYTDEEEKSTLLHVQIWKEKAIQNPEDWISRK